VNPTSVTGTVDGPGQVAITARSASPVRVPRKEPAMNDPRGRRLHSAKLKAPETRGAKKPHGRADPLAWVPGPDEHRSGMVQSVVTSDGTARPVNAEGNRRNLTRGVLADLSVFRARAVNRPGR